MNLTEKQISDEELEVLYNEYAAECRAALRLTLARIQNLKEAIDRSGQLNPFDTIESRIKTYESVKGKCLHKGYALTIDEIRNHIKDVAGIRVITKYADHVTRAVELLENFPGFNVITKKDYVSEPKPNGYSSIHLVCQVEVYTGIGGSRLIPVEIQVRSLSMHLWASLEHDLKYKKLNPPPETDEKFLKIIKILRKFDEEVVALRDYDESESS